MIYADIDVRPSEGATLPGRLGAAGQFAERPVSIALQGSGPAETATDTLQLQLSSRGEDDDGDV